MKAEITIRPTDGDEILGEFSEPEEALAAMKKFKASVTQVYVDYKDGYTEYWYRYGKDDNWQQGTYGGRCP